MGIDLISHWLHLGDHLTGGICWRNQQGDVHFGVTFPCLLASDSLYSLTVSLIFCHTFVAQKQTFEAIPCYTYVIHHHPTVQCTCIVDSKLTPVFSFPILPHYPLFNNCWFPASRFSTEACRGANLKSVVDAKTVAASDNQAAPGFCARVGHLSIFDMKWPRE